MNERIRLRVNDEDRDLIAPVNKTLLEVLREDLQLTGTKHGCELGECGTCTVLVDGEPVLSCLALAVDFQDGEIRTVEGLARGADPHELQVAFGDLGASQCGYCSPGMLMSASALLRDNPDPTRDQVRDYLAGNLCRCTGYLKILEAVELAGAKIRHKAATGDPYPSHVHVEPPRPQDAPADDIRPVEGKRGSDPTHPGGRS